MLRLAILAALAACGPAVAPPAAPAAAPAPARSSSARAVYIRDTPALLAAPAARDLLLARIRTHIITAVVPYGLAPLLADEPARDSLARWIGELHAAGASVIVPIAAPERLAAIDALVATHPDAEPDGLVTEAEFWNARDRTAALDALLGLLAAMRRAAATWPHGHPVTIGAYLGYPTRAEAARLAAALDFVFLDYSVSSPERAWSWVHARGGPLRDRFGWFAAAHVAIWPIFYAAGEVDMSRSLRAAGVAAAEARFRADLAADPDAALAHATVAGFVYFTLEAMPERW